MERLGPLEAKSNVSIISTELLPRPRGNGDTSIKHYRSLCCSTSGHPESFFPPRACHYTCSCNSSAITTLLPFPYKRDCPEPGRSRKRLDCVYQGYPTHFPCFRIISHNSNCTFRKNEPAMADKHERKRRFDFVRWCSKEKPAIQFPHAHRSSPICGNRRAGSWGYVAG